ncbi:MAG: S-methyl-5-thioribose-1-phosphate isomerase [Magnetococcales bacterium]|nr:S-methyl-5-thioribose-1-phosphate isomerase [Magnetococcales bacterium]MBF0115900.1 S-methyl-5-thioribose-1-phosphate isomerase [Magnetococcales bacterium]
MAVFDVAVWRAGKVRMLDQRALPLQEIYLEYGSAQEVAEAIRAMVVRGAPAIGCAAAFGVAVEAFRLAAQGMPASWEEALAPGMAALRESRPTAVNLVWALQRMSRLLQGLEADRVPERLLCEAEAIRQEDIESCREMGRLGADYLLVRGGQRPLTLLTHCNAGALATAGYGTALGVIRAAVDRFTQVRVYASETRPYLQGARLTAWELLRDGIETTLITDGMAGHLMQSRGVDAVVVGADRVAANGDAANKIGTYSLSVLAARHGIPFLVVCPLSTIDLATPTGAGIPIEERAAEEVTHYAGQRTAAMGVQVFNPAFDVTPAELITALVTEEGVVEGPDAAKIAGLFARRG